MNLKTKAQELHGWMWLALVVAIFVFLAPGCAVVDGVPVFKGHDDKPVRQDGLANK